MRKAADVAPLALLVMAIGCFLIVGIFRTDYYHHAFETRFPDWGAWCLAVFAAVIEEGTRLSLLVASMRDFTDNRKGNGWLGLVGSVALVIWEIHTAAEIASLWALGKAADQGVYLGFLVFMVLLAFLLEIRLILTMKDGHLGNEKARQNGRIRSREKEIIVAN